MTTAYDVPPVLLIERLKEKLQSEGKIKPPEWAPFARTGVNTEKAPVQKDWWYRRGAAVLREGYPHGPGGAARLPPGVGGGGGAGGPPQKTPPGARPGGPPAVRHTAARGGPS